MNSRIPSSLAESLSKLSVGISRTSIRHAHGFKRGKKVQPHLTRFEPGWGEQIWVHHHMVQNMIVYSHSKIMASNKAHAQIPFNGKKMKPAKLRRDYWRPMACIQFPQGLGVVGRSVYQKLREYRRLHELSWGWQAEEMYKLETADRGKLLNDQKANAIADIAAVLGGAGRGNLMWVDPEETRLLEGRRVTVKSDDADEDDAGPALSFREKYIMSKIPEDKRLPPVSIKIYGPSSSSDDAPEEGVPTATTIAATDSETAAKALLDTTIFWEYELDAAHAREWTPNVKHQKGLPSRSDKEKWELIQSKRAQGTGVGAQEIPSAVMDMGAPGQVEPRPEL